MSTIVHFINVGQGNMTLMQLNDGKNLCYDCNITNNNESDVLSYVRNTIGTHGMIDIFVNSHRDADHMRGIKKLHSNFPIKKIWDSGVTGGTTNSSEYLDYMDLKRRVQSQEIESSKIWTFAKTKLRIMNSKNDNLSHNHNAQSIVIKVEHYDVFGKVSSAMLAGDSDAISWKDAILNNYSQDSLKSQILLAAHHGSISFFDDPSDEQNYYTDHIEQINPQMTIVSVGSNSHGHPDDKAIELYETYSTGSKNGTKIKRTDKHGNIKLELKDNGSYSLWSN